MNGRAWAAAGAALLAVVCVQAPAHADSPTSADQPSVAFTIDDPRVTESSGLVASTQHPNVYWTHNDSGDNARVFAVGADGHTLARLTLDGVDARDCEAIALGKDGQGRPALFLADIGDNLGGTWPEVYIYRITEPAQLTDATVPVTRYRVRYADGPRNAETLMIDPRNNRLYIASKESNGGLYEQPASLSPDRVNVFTRVAAAPPLATDGSFSPDGSRFVVRGYFSATMYAAPGREVGPVTVPLQRQGESVTFAADGRSLLVGSEGKDSQVWRVPLSGDLLPDAVRGAAPPTGRGTHQAGETPVTATGGSSSGSTATLRRYGLPAAAVLVGLGLVAVAVRRARR